MKLKKHKSDINVTYQPYFITFCKWLKLVNEGKNLQSFFSDNSIETIAIYGMGELGQEIYKALLKLDINILYAIDKNAEYIEIEGLRVIKPSDVFEKVDAIIVTPLQYFDEIEDMLEKKGIDNIISLEDLVVYCL